MSENEASNIKVLNINSRWYVESGLWTKARKRYRLVRVWWWKTSRQWWWEVKTPSSSHWTKYCPPAAVRPTFSKSEVDQSSTVPFPYSGILEGFNGTIFAYGQTASGKTHTMYGTLNDPVQKGIIPRIIDVLFDIVQNLDSSTQITIKLSMVEIYKEKIRDLLRI